MSLAEAALQVAAEDDAIGESGTGDRTARGRPAAKPAAQQTLPAKAAP
jgi:hypothetical protein